jgi:hypothetical protein
LAVLVWPLVGGAFFTLLMLISIALLRFGMNESIQSRKGFEEICAAFECSLAGGLCA